MTADVVEFISRLELISEKIDASNNLTVDNHQKLSKVAQQFGKIADVISIVNNPSYASALKNSDMLFYQESIQSMLSDISDTLSAIEAKII